MNKLTSIEEALKIANKYLHKRIIAMKIDDALNPPSKVLQDNNHQKI